MQDLTKLQELAAALPKEVKANATKLVQRMGEMIEGIGDEPIAWKPENLRLVQATTDRSRLPKNANIGSIIIGENIVAQPLKVTPIRMWDSRQMWSPDKDEARMLCSSPDAIFGYIGKYCKECEYAVFNTETNHSDCNKAKTVISITADFATIFVTNFTKTNYANGRDWATLMKKAGVAPYKKVYDMKSEPNKKYKNVEGLIISTQNESTPEAYIPFLEEMFTKVGIDRTSHIKKFYELVQSNNKNVGLLGSTPADDAMVTLPGAVIEGTAQQDSLAKKYTL